MKPFIVIVPGHGHRPDGLRWHPGAGDEPFQEANMVRIVARHLASMLIKTERDHMVCDALGVQDGHPHPLRAYSGRCRVGLAEAKKRGHTSAVVLHLHFNASGGKYGLVITDARAPSERKAAAPLVAALKRWGGAALSEVQNEDDVEYPNARGIHDSTWKGADGLGLQVSSFVLEPAFVDQPQHAGLLGDSGLELLARYIAEGLA